MDDDQIIEALPNKARKKFEELARVANAARAASRAAMDEAGDARADRDNRFAQWRRQVQNDRRLNVRDEPSDLVASREKVQRLATVAAEEAARANEIARPYYTSRSWLEQVIKAGSRIVFAGHPPLKSGNDLLAEVEVTRKQIAALEQEIAVVEAAPAPPETIRERALEALDRYAAAGQLQISPFSRGEDPAGIGAALRFQIVSGPEGGIGRASDGSVAFLAWALRDVLADKICKLIDGCMVKGALSDQEQDKKLAKLSGQKLEAERREEALIDAAAAARLIIPRRPDADPRAILGVSDQ